MSEETPPSLSNFLAIYCLPGNYRTHANTCPAVERRQQKYLFSILFLDIRVVYMPECVCVHGCNEGKSSVGEI